MRRNSRYSRTRRARRKHPLSGTLGIWTLVLVALGALIGRHIGDEPRTGPVTTAPPTEVSGAAQIIDGDTLQIRSHRIRLGGVDAPEAGQSCRDGSDRSYNCGAAATNALRGFLAGGATVSCIISERDHYGRLIGDCRRADGRGLAEWLVANGHALDWPRYSQGAYAHHQQQAMNGGRGMWGGSFQAPWEWRAAQDTQPEPVRNPLSGLVGASLDESDAPCRIKGNINARGERIYHMPGQEFYERTHIAQHQGERWFCSEAEARAAGWRRARR